MKITTSPQYPTTPVRRFGINLITSALLASALCAAPAIAQQAGGIKGKISADTAQSSVAGLTITASSNVMPKPRTAVTKADGSYSLPLLLPGKYDLTISNATGVVRKMQVEVQLEQTSTVDVNLGAGGADVEVIQVLGSAISREGNSALTNSLGAENIESLPVGQEYRDLLKLVPGVQYSENGTLGPSAGGSGVDNKYGFDGVDVSLPLFGNLASDPSTHDIASVSMDRGGAKAVGFNRAGGFSINTISKSGTNEFEGYIEYKLQDKSLTAKSEDVAKAFKSESSWITMGLAGPLIEDMLYFYGSFYRPETERANKETNYGPVKDYSSERNEYFGKLTFAPTDDLLFNMSLRDSSRESDGASVGAFDSDTVSVGEISDQTILTLDGSYLLSSNTSLSFNAGRFELETASSPDSRFGFQPVIGNKLDVNNLTSLGTLSVPTLIANATTPAQLAFNNFAQQLINQYGYTNAAGAKAGGGRVGGAPQINNQNFYRDSVEFAVDHELSHGDTTHKLHAGFKYSDIEEELSRLSNGWGSIAYTGGLQKTAAGVPYFYQTSTEQMSLLDASGKTVPPIKSAARSYNFEINDTITHGDFDYNIGVLISKDELFGQGLREKAGTVSGFELAPGNKYKMYTIDWKDMIQPRLGATWRYDGENTIFANYASYNPEASSLARAASWDRSTQRTLLVRFDENGNYLETANRGSSSGKVFADDLKPRRIDEFTLGTTKALDGGWFLRSHIRHREGSHFWEDIWNYARSREGTYGPNGGVPEDLRALGDYVKNLEDIRKEIGGSTYVIAEVDGGYTKYWEASFEAEWIGERAYLNASYVWSRYTGNFDQDNTTYTNDANTFIGSSYYNDDKGKYVWDNKDGTLSADKPHLLKVYGYYTLDWEANIGAYFVFQSGQAWEKWSGAYYGLNPRGAYDAVSAYAEKAGSRRSSSHWQMDLNYTQDYVINPELVVKFRADLFNVFDRQTGYDIEPIDYATQFGKPRRWYNPRRVQLSVRVDF